MGLIDDWASIAARQLRLFAHPRKSTSTACLSVSAQPEVGFGEGKFLIFQFDN
jgi:hypothetical protein